MNKREENLAENKAHRRKFIGIIIGSSLLGAIIGFCAGYFGGLFGAGASFAQAIADALNAFFLSGAPLLVPVICAATFLVSHIYYRRAKQQFATWDNENEATLHSMGQSIDIALACNSIFTIVLFFLFSGYFTRVVQNHMGLNFAVFLLAFIGLVGQIVASTLYQKLFVDLTKEINPEKHGSVYDRKFAKKWLESCDEAERAAIYQSAFKAYKNAVGLCTVLWAALTIASIVWDIGVLPVACVSAIWLALSGSYLLECLKLSRAAAAAAQTGIAP